MKLVEEKIQIVSTSTKVPDISFFIGTNRGLLFFNNNEFVKLIDCDLVYGITYHGNRWWVYTCTGKKGKIVSFDFTGNTINDFRIEIQNVSKKNTSNKIHKRYACCY